MLSGQERGAPYSNLAASDRQAIIEILRATKNRFGGVAVGSTFRKTLFALKFKEGNLLLSDLVNSNSKILWDRTPRERVEKVAPWLTVDGDRGGEAIAGIRCKATFLSSCRSERTSIF